MGRALLITAAHCLSYSPLCISQNSSVKMNEAELQCWINRRYLRDKAPKYYPGPVSWTISPNYINHYIMPLSYFIVCDACQERTHYCLVSQIHSFQSCKVPPCLLYSAFVPQMKGLLQGHGATYESRISFSSCLDSVISVLSNGLSVKLSERRAGLRLPHSTATTCLDSHWSKPHRTLRTPVCMRRS